MRTLALLIGILAIVCMVAPVYCAQEEGAPVTAPEAVTISGSVTKIDTEKSEITLKDEAGVEKVLTVTEDTAITKSDKEIGLTSIGVDDKVTAELERDEVVSIEVSE